MNMKKWLGAGTAWFVLGSGTLMPQRGITAQDFDSEAVFREVQIMKSIFDTSLSLLQRTTEETRSPGSRHGGRRGIRVPEELSSRVEGYYLFGQGVVFTVTAPPVPRGSAEHLAVLEARLDQLKQLDFEANSELLQAQMYLAQNEIELARQEYDVYRLAREMAEDPSAAPPVPLPEPGIPEPPLPPGLEEDETAKQERKEEIRARVERMKKRLQESRENLETERALAEEQREKLMLELLRVVANHGDTLTQLKPENFINVVVTEQSEFLGWADSQVEEATILSVRKSDVSAYKTGQLTFDQFRARVIQY